MKYFLFAVLTTFLIAVACAYILIPDNIVVSRAEPVESSERIIDRFLNNGSERLKWWPSAGRENIADSSELIFNDYKYQFGTPGNNSNEVLISKDKFTSPSRITWISSPNNTILLGWKTTIAASNNPVKRILQYQQARKIKSNMVAIMDSLLTYVVHSKNVYGFDVKRETVKDTILATSSILTRSYPKTQQVYSLINSVEAFVKKQDARQTNAPMLNISRTPEGIYQTMIALPINKDIKPGGTIYINHMVSGNILVTEVKGGPQNISYGFSQMKQYMKDFKLTSPAMPFEQLLTDRNTEPDTTKWTTKIYYPIL